jgi:hypothetical protein
MHYISILSTIIAFTFAVAVFERYHRRKGLHLLLWGIGLVFYGFGTLTEVFMLFTFHGLALKVWYLSGAMLTAAWLGQGTVHLLVRKRNVALTLTAILGLISLLAIGLVFAAPLTSAAVNFDLNQPISTQYKEILTRSGGTIALTILLNLYGTVTLIGGAIYSAWVFWRKHILVNRMVGNVLIAAGALLPAMGGTFISLGLADWLYVSEFLGAVLMYLGFVKAVAPQPAEETSPTVPVSTG